MLFILPLAVKTTIVSKKNITHVQLNYHYQRLDSSPIFYKIIDIYYILKLECIKFNNSNQCNLMSCFKNYHRLVTCVSDCVPKPRKYINIKKLV